MLVHLPAGRHARLVGDGHVGTLHASDRPDPPRRRRRPPLVVRPRLRARLPRAESLPQAEPRAASAVAARGVEPEPVRRGRGADRRARAGDRVRRMAVLPGAPPPGSGLVARRHGHARPAARRHARRRAVRAPPREADPPRGGRARRAGGVPVGDGANRQLHRRPDRRRRQRRPVGGAVPGRGRLPASRRALRRRQEPAAGGVPAPGAPGEPDAGRGGGAVRLLVRIPALLHRPVPRLSHPSARPRNGSDAEHRDGRARGGGPVPLASAAAGPVDAHGRMGGRGPGRRGSAAGGRAAARRAAPRLRRSPRPLPDDPEQLDAGCAAALRRAAPRPGALVAVSAHRHRSATRAAARERGCAATRRRGRGRHPRGSPQPRNRGRSSSRRRRPPRTPG